MLESTIKARRDRKGQGSQLVLALLSLPIDDDASVMDLGKTKGAALANGLTEEQEHKLDDVSHESFYIEIRAFAISYYCLSCVSGIDSVYDSQKDAVARLLPL